MRMLPATLGVLTVPISYLTLRALDCRATTALLASLFITFENGMITQSRLILLDSPLIFFTALTILVWTGFCNEDKREPFTESWWLWLTLTGLSLGAGRGAANPLGDGAAAEAPQASAFAELSSKNAFADTVARSLPPRDSGGSEYTLDFTEAGGCVLRETSSLSPGVRPLYSRT